MAAINVAKYGAEQHDHMLACGVGYFAGQFPERYELVKVLPLEDAVAVIREHYREIIEQEVGG